MEKQLPISVCMSMYNVAPYVGECIDSILAQILDYCQQRVSCDSGLYEGKAGFMLLLLLYYGLTHDIKHKSMAISLLQDIGHSLSKANSIPFTFSHGLLGIGWSLLYLADYGLIASV